jgi:hypothetical protein
MGSSAILKIWRKIFHRLESKNKIAIKTINEWRLLIFRAQEQSISGIFNQTINSFRIMERKYEKERQKNKVF